MLLVAMIGAIVLTHRHKPGIKRPGDRRTVRRQNMRRTGMDATRNTNPPVGAGSRRCDPSTVLQEPTKDRKERYAHDRGPVEHYLTVSAILFVMGVLGIFINRQAM